MKSSYFLVIDAGTSAVRALVFDQHGHRIAGCRRKWQYHSVPEAGFLAREFNMEQCWNTVCEAIRATLSASHLPSNSIAGITATSQREGIVLLDKNDRELYGSPNIDLRAVVTGNVLDSENRNLIYSITGHLPSFMFTPARLKWFEQHQSDTFNHINSVLAINDWITFRLSSQKVSDICTMAELGLADVSRRCLSAELLNKIGIPFSLFPEIVPSGSRVGTVVKKAADETGLAAGTPVIQGGPDSQCGLLGAGITEPNEIGIITGWSAPIQMVTPEPVFNSEGALWTSCYVNQNTWILESTTGEAGNAYAWIKSALFSENGIDSDDVYKMMDDLALSAPQGCDGVLAYLGPDAMNMNRLAMNYGGFIFPVPFSAGTIDKGYLIRAALENICYAIKANIEQLERSAGMTPHRLLTGGNLTRSTAFRTLLPSVLSRPVHFCREPETTGLGAALCSAAGSRICSTLDEAIAKMKSELYTGEPDTLEAADYEDYYQQWILCNKKLQEAGEVLQ